MALCSFGRRFLAGYFRPFSAGARDFPLSTSLTSASEWKEEISQYVSYNQEYLDGEKAHAIEAEEKRQRLTRQEKIRKGQLAKIVNWSNVRKHVYLLIGPRKLPANHLLVKGQPVILRDHYRKSKGVIIELRVQKKENVRFIVEMYDLIDMDDFDLDETELEYTTDLAAFERMQKALTTITNQYRLPAWLMLAIASKTGTLADLSHIAVHDAEYTDTCIGEVSNLMTDPKRTISLNQTQKDAILNSVICALSIIQGPPGTGKTHTAATIVDYWLEWRGRTRSTHEKVLVVAQSNKAVDQLCSAILNRGLKPLRIGSAAKAHEKVNEAQIEHWLKAEIEKLEDDQKRGYANTGFSKDDLVKRIVQSAEVICATCIGSGHKDLESLGKDDIGLVVLDEATQAAELECLVPLTRFPNAQVTLIGDQKQLPPTILSPVLEANNEEYSLFGRFIEAREKGLFIYEKPIFSQQMLTTQYRMHPDISAFPNRKFYDSKLINGYNSDRSLVPPRNLWPLTQSSRHRLLLMNCEGSEKTSKQNSTYNLEEAYAVVDIVRKLIDAGQDLGGIGVITFYTAQVHTIRKALQASDIRINATLDPKKKRTKFDFVEVNSVDAFQGSEVSLLSV